MKRITIEVDDGTTIDMAALSPIIAVATKFNIETVDTGVATTRTQFKPGRGETAFGEIMSHFTPEGVFSGAAAGSWVLSKGWAAGTASAALSQLCQARYLRNLGSGRWQFLRPMDPGTKLGSKSAVAIAQVA